MEHYESGFSAGMKIEIRIPVPYAKAFTDWAVVNTLQQDHISLQLSRDVLPEGVSLRVGQVLECRNPADKSGCSHQAIVVSKGFAQDLQLRLIGEIAANEHREFFRIDIFLPVAYHIIRNQSIYNLQKQLALRRKQRKTDEAARKKRYLEECNRRQNRRSSTLANGNPPPHETNQPDKPGCVTYDESWHDVIPTSVNICGGGMSLVTDHGFAVDEFVLVELLIPSSQRVVDLVARVIFTNQIHPAGSEQTCFNTGMQFVFIDEGDRSVIVNHIALIQTQRLRQMQGFSDEPLYNAEKDLSADNHGARRKAVDDQPAPTFSWISLILVMGALVCCGICVMLVLLLVSSANGRFKEFGSSIGSSFDKMRGK